MSNKEPPGPWRLIRLGTTMAALVAGGVLLGWFVDGRVHTQPVFTLTGLAVGMVATCWYGYATIRRFL
ncbi:MAG TPA: AtpZ/AtpI family protein [Pseudonocardiaceae bacterium]